MYRLSLLLCVIFSISSSIRLESQTAHRRVQTPAAPARLRPVAKNDSTALKPQRFLGWKYASRAGKGYAQRFERPRAGLAKPRVAVVTSPLQLGQQLRKAASVPGSQSYPALALRPIVASGFIPDSIATADFNGDGNADWAVANGGDNNVWVYLGNGDGTFSPPLILSLAGVGPTAVATADLRGNGKIDIIVAEADTNNVEVFLGNGNGTFQSIGVTPLNGIPSFIAAADFNKDGHPDLAISLVGTSPIAVLPGNGDGTFGAPIYDTWGDGGAALVSLSVADVNRDGNLDLGFVDAANGSGIVLGNGNGSFGQPNYIAADIPEVGLSYFTVALGDVNGDGCPDFVTTDSFAFVEIYTGNCSGTFSSTPQFYGAGDISVSLALEDVDGDGNLDIVTAGDYFGNIIGSGDDSGDLLCILKGNGQGGFDTAHVYRGLPGMYSLAFLQLQGVSVPSVLAVNQDTDAITLFKNDGTGDFGPPRGLALGYQGGTSNAPYGGFVAADVNGDGQPDLISVDVPQYGGGMFQLSTMLNLGAGQFAPRTLSALFPDSYYVTGDFAVGDFRNTGVPDVIAVGENSSFSLSTPFLAFAENNGNGTFAPATIVTPPTATGLIGVGDFNRDGKLDFVTLSGGSSSEAQSFNVFLGNGDGTFNPQPPVYWGGVHARWPLQVFAGDFNADGKMDVMVHLYDNVIPYSVNDVYVFYGNGDGTFQQPVQLYSNFDPFTLVDLNRDGIPDIVTCRFPDSFYPDFYTPLRTQVLLALPGGGFGPPTDYDITYPGFSALPSFDGGEEAGFHEGFCSVGDFNGDGNPDIAVMQLDNLQAPEYVQFLSGNGDGTFTPTYNIYSFGRPTLPQEWYDLNADGKTDLLEMDGLTSSFNFVPGTTASSFQLETVTEPITSNVGSAQVSLNVPSSSDTTFTLQASDPGLQLPASVTVPAGAVSQPFTYTVTSLTDLHHVFEISATLGAEQASVYNFVQTDHRLTTGFSFVLEQSSEQVYPGLASTDYEPSYSTQPNYSTSLSLSCSGLAVGLTCNFVPPVATLGPDQSHSGSLFVDASMSTAPGTYNFEVTASDTNSSVTFPASVIVLPPAPNVHVTGPINLNGVVNAPIQIPYTITNTGDIPAHNTVVTVSFQYVGVATVTVLTTTMGSCSLSTNSCSLGTVNPGDMINVTVTILPVTTQVTVSLAATQTEQNAGNETAFTTLLLADFNFSLSPSSLTIHPGSQGATTVSIYPQNNFSFPISFSCAGLPAGATCTFSPSTVTPGSNMVSTTLAVSVPETGATSRPARFRSARPLAALCLLPVGFLVLPGRRKKRLSLLCITLLIAILIGLQSCGGSGSGSSGGGTGGTGGGTQSPNYSVQVVGNGSGDQHQAVLALTVQ